MVAPLITPCGCSGSPRIKTGFSKVVRSEDLIVFCFSSQNFSFSCIFFSSICPCIIFFWKNIISVGDGDSCQQLKCICICISAVAVHIFNSCKALILCLSWPTICPKDWNEFCQYWLLDLWHSFCYCVCSAADFGSQDCYDIPRSFPSDKSCSFEFSENFNSYFVSITLA